MPLQRPDYQLTLDLVIDEQQPEGMSADDARIISETARDAFEASDFAWKSEYLNLRNGGWNWRVAAYIAWASAPKPRTPKTQDELAQNHLGLNSARAIITWRKKNPAIDEMVATLQASPLWDYRAEVFRALTSNAVKPDYKTHNDRKLFLELTGDYVPTAKLQAMLTKGTLNKNELRDMSDADLAALARSLMTDQIENKTETKEE